MAKPEHTAYQIQADFSDKESFVKIMTEDGMAVFTGPVALNTSCIQAGKIKSAANPRKNKTKRIIFAKSEYGYVNFGYSKADAMLDSVRKIAKIQFTKGERPSFFLRKLTMSEFMTHEQFQSYKGSELIKSLYKKYLLMDLLK